MFRPLTDSAKVDEVVQYIDWAVANKFAVMDVNVPSYEDNNNVSFHRPRQRAGRDLGVRLS